MADYLSLLYGFVYVSGCFYLSVCWRLSASLDQPRHICLTGHQNLGIADPSLLGDDEKVCI